MNFDGYISALGLIQANAIPAMSMADLYNKGGIYARVIDKPAGDAVARGFDLVEGDDDKQAQAEFDRLAVLPKLSDALRLSLLNGGAALVPICDDAASMAAPLNVERVRRITGLRVFPVDDFSVRQKYSDITQENYGEPELYEVRRGTGHLVVHASRIIPVAGDPLALASEDIPWKGRAVASRLFASISRWSSALDYSLEILKRKQQAVHRMKGLADAIGGGMEDEVRKRVGLVDGVRNALNGVTVDSEDDYTVIDLSTSGIRELIAEYQIAVSAECGIPVAILFGRSAAGMNATGEADFEAYYDYLETLQRTKLTPALERITELVLAQDGMQDIGDWFIQWKPLKSPTEKQQAELDKLRNEALAVQASTLDKLIASDMMSAEEGRASLIEHGNHYGLTNEATPPLPVPDAD